MNDQTCLDPQRVSQRAERRIYQSPSLNLLGDVCSLTETGSMNGMEDFLENGMCFFPSMTNNMC